MMLIFLMGIYEFTDRNLRRIVIFFITKKWGCGWFFHFGGEMVFRFPFLLCPQTRGKYNIKYSIAACVLHALTLVPGLSHSRDFFRENEIRCSFLQAVLIRKLDSMSPKISQR